MRCPVCGTALRLALKEETPDDAPVARREAWQDVEYRSQLREAGRAPDEW